MLPIRTNFGTGLTLALLLTSAPVPAAQPLPAHQQLARDVYKQLIEIDTTDSVGDNTAAAEAMAARFRAAGFPAADVFVGGPVARKGNLVVRYRGRPGATLKPLLLLAHLDVVEAKKEDWSPGLDPGRIPPVSCGAGSRRRSTPWLCRRRSRVRSSSRPFQ